MTRLVVSVNAEADIAAILDYLEIQGGASIAAVYGDRFADTIERLVNFPKFGVPRLALGSEARIVLVYPYILIYDFAQDSEVITILRVLHGKRDITKKLMPQSVS